MSYPMFHPSSHSRPADELTAEQFAAEFPAEGEHVEFKEGASHSRIAQAAMAFSNADGGVILVGVTDRGFVKGADLSVSSDTSLRQTLGQVRELGPYRIHRLSVDGRVVVAISVGPRKHSFAQLPNGQVKQRRGASNQTLLGADLADFIARRFGRSTESSATRLTTGDIDPGLGQQLAGVWQWTERSGSSPELLDRLRDNGFVVLSGACDRLSVAGALFLLPNPSTPLGKAHVEVFRYPDDGINYDRREEFTGPLHHQVPDAAGFVLEELGVDLATIGVWRHELHRLPEPVVREAITNAVAHRSYAALGEAVRVEIRPDRVIVRSPGGLPHGVSLDSLSQQSNPRNVLVIRTLRYFGVAEDAGRGVDLMYRHMALNLMAPPKFETDDSSVTVTLRLRSEASPLERAWLAQTLTSATGTADRPYSVGDGVLVGGLEPSDVRLLVLAARGEALTNTVVRNLLGVNASRASRVLARLRDRGLLQQQGAGAGAAYALSPEIAKPDGTRIKGTDFDAEVLARAVAGPIANADVRLATGLDRIAVVKILNRLVGDGQLERRGSKRGTHYVLRPRRWDHSKGDVHVALDRTAEGHYEASIWVGNLSARTITEDAQSRMTHDGVPESTAHVAAFVERLPRAMNETTERQLVATHGGAWELDTGDTRIEVTRTPEGPYEASITVAGSTAVFLTRSTTSSFYQGVNFQWPELARFLDMLAVTVLSQEASF